MRGDSTIPATNGPHLGRAFMLDTILLAAGVGFFAVAVLYVLACDKM
jgi:hypothetical protein